jgi:hypothetical protein
MRRPRVLRDHGSARADSPPERGVNGFIGQGFAVGFEGAALLVHTFDLPGNATARGEEALDESCALQPL